MTLITPGEDDARSEELLLEVHESLRDLRCAFKSLKERVNTGEDVKASEVKSRFLDLHQTLINCQKLETQLVEIRQKRRGIAQNGYALDLDAARSEVWCALGRIRTCGGSADVS